ncbi:DNA polymerase delta small subunit [Schistosoma japonicum]|uniref:DNA polymerase delta small subunit n=1 Tax=Schistosoma japonicum TaxID=6182 RepID=A0A4Z2CW40_SCHJA|nr:DNA polymerase delta small subunit [Schistosoma japonicum]KAH8855513.1 DNA polymerase delta small subunit [Schistosoma japonicum]KAH8855514.1 DNA polymerase delta small subunit [Schistosoma japonicum]TNN08482.1 DNA polymerase delta small subunit [Schistosoma japonicum]
MTVSLLEEPDCSLSCRRFQVTPDSFSFHRQYTQIYLARLAAAKPLLTVLAKNKWSKSPTKSEASHFPIRSLADLNADEKCIIIGTVFKEMRLKPSVLHDIAAVEIENIESDNRISSTDTQSMIRLTSVDDVLFLEDEVQRIALSFCSHISKCWPPANLVTGVVIAVLGCEPESHPGSFYVEDMLFLQPQPEKPIHIHEIPHTDVNITTFRNSGPWLGVVSGLGFAGSGQVKPGHSIALQLLADWIRCAGDFYNSSESHTDSGLIHLLILGDSIRAPKSNVENDGDRCTPAVRLTQRARYLTRNADAETVTAMARFDQWLASLPIGPGSKHDGKDINGISVDLLPGPSDPASVLMPQQPIHSAALPCAVSCSGGVGSGNLCGRTNPYSFMLRNRNILATSGQGVNELYRYTKLETSCDRMEATLLWGHLAPTCPDTLGGYPMINIDPLLLRSSSISATQNFSPDYPDIYVAGCQPGDKPSWRRARLKLNEGSNRADSGCLLVSVPRFDSSSSFVLINLKSLDCRVVRFDSSLLDEENTC